MPGAILVPGEMNMNKLRLMSWRMMETDPKPKYQPVEAQKGTRDLKSIKKELEDRLVGPGNSRNVSHRH